MSSADMPVFLTLHCGLIPTTHSCHKLINQVSDDFALFSQVSLAAQP